MGAEENVTKRRKRTKIPKEFKVDYLSIIESSYNKSITAGTSEAFKIITRSVKDENIRAILISIVVRKYTKNPSVAVSDIMKFTGKDKFEAQSLSILGYEILALRYELINALIPLLANKAKVATYSTASKLLKFICQGDTDNLRASDIAQVDVNTTTKNILKQLYPTEVLTCPMCHTEKPLSEFPGMSKYCEDCRKLAHTTDDRVKLSNHKQRQLITAVGKTKKNIEKVEKKDGN